MAEAIKTYSQRAVEAALIATHSGSSSSSFGDIVYLDRGRMDGLEMGVVFSVYDFFDRGEQRRISLSPTYKIGELTVVHLTDNFATAVVSESTDVIRIGHLAFTKSEEEAMTEKGEAQVSLLPARERVETDIELNVEDLSDDLLKEADKVQLTAAELEELERQEREKSVLKEHEKDLLDLEKLEKEINLAESSLNEVKVDEDKFLEQQDLDALERNKAPGPNAVKDLDEIEKEIGRKYMDENLNSRDNPYGLTEFDLEEIDELLNTESL